jgi:uncharacterized protein with von Willebrand factor type A (vWA) domain
MADDRDPLSRLVEFGRALRGSGVAVGSGQLLAYCRGMAVLDPTDLDDLYWAGRTTLLSRHSDIALYDRVFDRFFRGGEVRLAASAAPGSLPPAVSAQPLAATNASAHGAPDEAPVGTVASSHEALRRKPFSSCTPEELAALRDLIARLRLNPPRRASRRTEHHRRGRRPDLRRSLRRSLRSGGELLEPSWRRRRSRARRIVLLLDVSGSMADYSRALLQFAYSAARSGGEVETFCFATRLTRITGTLRRRDPDTALAEASEAVLDWDGGTRIGEAIAEFTRSWGRRGLARGAVVVVCSDGLERGDPEVLALEMERLRRLAHRIVWVNPLTGDPRYEPLARGMRAALDFVDAFVPGHDLASLEALADLIPATRDRGRRPLPGTLMLGDSRV